MLYIYYSEDSVCCKLHNECFVRRDAITNLASYLRLLMASGLNIYRRHEPTHLLFRNLHDETLDG